VRILKRRMKLMAGMENEPARALSLCAFPGDRRSVMVIDRPGVYALVQDVSGVRGKSGIRIEADRVGLFLGCFALRGCAGSLDGVEVACRGASLVVRGGAIEGWGRHGVNGRMALRCDVEGVRLDENQCGAVAQLAGGIPEGDSAHGWLWWWKRAG